MLVNLGIQLKSLKNEKDFKFYIFFSLSDAELEWLSELRTSSRRVEELKPILFRLHQISQRLQNERNLGKDLIIFFEFF